MQFNWVQRTLGQLNENKNERRIERRDGEKHIEGITIKIEREDNEKEKSGI